MRKLDFLLERNKRQTRKVEIQIERGEKGERGELGPRGFKGDKGEHGIRGDQGLTGPQGLKGEKGDKGDAGIRGKDAIQKELIAGTNIQIDQSDPTRPIIGTTFNKLTVGRTSPNDPKLNDLWVDTS